MHPNVSLLLIIGVILVLLSRMKSTGILSTMALAIQEFEGWYPGSRSYRNNNPGNLRWFGSNIPWKGATGVDETGHVIFDCYNSGFNALVYQLRLAFENRSGVYNSAMSLYEFFRKYAEGNQTAYAEYVAKRLGVSPSTTLEDLKA